MGRDNHPRARQAKKLARKKASCDSYDRILIVCEGRKTEPYYFGEIQRYYRLNSANINILPGAYGTSPQQVVDFAKDTCLATRRWEQVFCVFDRDDHLTFHNALQSAKALDNRFKNEYNKPIQFTAIQSIPSFELWLLLHFRCVTHEIHRDEVMRLLNQPGCLPGYTKGNGGYFELTRHLLNTAYSHAERLAEDRQRLGNENPFTAVYELVKLLTTLKPS